MKRSSKLLGATLLGLGCAGTLLAGDQLFDFNNSDVTSGGGVFAGSIIAGNHTYNNVISGTKQFWSSGNIGGSTTGTNGFPNTGGYLSISDPTNGNNSLAFVFPDVDGGLPVRNFQIDLDMRVGDGSQGRPADGFSISFCRKSDPVLINLAANSVNGFAGADNLTAAQASAGSGDVENGTKTGVAVIFDAWQGNYLPDTTPADGSSPGGPLDGHSNDREGIAVRVDDHTLVQLNLINNRNLPDATNATGVSCTQSNSDNGPNIAPANTYTGYTNGWPYIGGLSLQTGTNAFVTAGFGTCTPTYGGTDTTGGAFFTNFVWEHLMIRLTNDPTPKLTVTWKGATVIQTNLATFSATAGRLLIAGRCGGNCQGVHVDNIKVHTDVTSSTYIYRIQGLPDGFSLYIADNPPNSLTSVDSLVLDGVTNVTAFATVGSGLPYFPGSIITYRGNVRFPTNTTHTLVAGWHDASGAQSGTIAFTVNYYPFPPSLAIPISSIDTTQPGFQVKAYQQNYAMGNTPRFLDEVTMGLRGTNMISGALQSYSGPVDFYNGSGASIGYGFFSENTDLSTFGIGVGTYSGGAHDFYDQSCLELFGYVYFPTSGVYNCIIGADDIYSLSVSQNPKDRMGNVVAAITGNRLLGLNGTTVNNIQVTDVRQFVVDTPGCYPVRLAWENATGGAGLEWFTVNNSADYTASVADSDAFLVNDTAHYPSPNGTIILAYQAVLPGTKLGPYVSYANPVRDSQNVVFYQPILLDLTDGTSTGTINDSTVSFTCDGVNLNPVKTRSGSVLHLVQGLVTNWPSGFHTNVLTFNDNGGTPYTYTYGFCVLGSKSPTTFAVLEPTNTPFAPQLTLAEGVPAGQVDTTKPGFKVHSYQTPMEVGQANASFSDAELQGEHGANVADQSGAVSGSFTFNNVMDFRVSTLATDALGEWFYDVSDYSPFGVGNIVTPYAQSANCPFYRFNSSQNTLEEQCSVEFGAWLIFPKAGWYAMAINNDDGFRVMIPQGTPFGKLPNSASSDNTTARTVDSNTARGMAGANGGFDNGGSFFMFNVPAANTAYPFRILVYNGGTGAGCEASIYSYQPNGGIARLPLNDASQPGSIMAYQSLSSGEPIAPWASHVDPVPFEQDTVAWEPTTIDLNDGAGTHSIKDSTVTLYSDGNLQTITKTRSGGLLHIVQQLVAGQLWATGNHTNLLTYQDNAGTTYSNAWPFTAVGPNFNIVNVPASYVVPMAQIDTTKPGFRVKSYETVAADQNSSSWWEGAFLGQYGANIAPQDPSGSFTWTNPVDFADNVGINTSSGEYRYNYTMSNAFNIQLNGGGGAENYAALLFAGYMVFPQAGIYAMTVNSDDGFKITMPQGNAWSAAGLVLGGTDAGRGNTTGGAANPFRGSVTPNVFNIPVAGAYPIRMLYYNGTGGINLEWTIFQFGADGGVERQMVNDPVVPDAVKVYQTLNTNAAYVANFLTGPGGTLPNGLTNTYVNGTIANNTSSGLIVAGQQATITLGGTAGAQTGPANNDLYVSLQDGTVPVSTSGITFSLNGFVLNPTVVTNGNGLTGVFLSATNTIWPSGQYGPLMVNFQDTSGHNYSYVVAYIQTPFDMNTLHGGFVTAAADTAKPGFKVKTYQVDPAITDGGVNAGAVTTTGLGLVNRVYVAEQFLAGVWGPNQANLGPISYAGGVNYAGFTDGGYFDLKGTGPSNGVVNVNAQYPAQSGDFVYNVAGSPFNSDMPMPGLPGLGPTIVNNARSNSVALEFLAYVQFPTNGIYTLGSSGDDGFRAEQGWVRPVNVGALMVNSPASLAGYRATAINQSEQPVASTPITAAISGNIVLATGVWGAATNGDGCAISNPSALNGNIAIMYRSAFCGFNQQAEGAALCGAKAVIIVQKRRPLTDGVFPEEFTINPPVGVPTVMIEEADGNSLIAALATNNVNVTLNPVDYQINPPANNPVLGQTSAGKGNSDCNFRVIVTNAPGIYPIRFVYWNGNGGVNVEFYSLTGNGAVNGGRVLINDRSTTNGLALNAYYGLVPPTITSDGVNLTISYNAAGGAQLQSANNLVAPITWTPVVASDPLVIPISSSAAQKYYRSVYTQRQ